MADVLVPWNSHLRVTDWFRKLSRVRSSAQTMMKITMMMMTTTKKNRRKKRKKQRKKRKSLNKLSLVLVGRR